MAARYVIDRGVRKAVKTCASCGRDFTWRKKWERCWDDVKYCSKRCRRDRPLVASDWMREGGHSISPKQTRKERKRAAKKLQREKRALNVDNRRKCDVCSRLVNMTIRCTIDETKEWKHVCGTCWHSVSGGCTDGDADHPFYVYGGLWRNRK